VQVIFPENSGGARGGLFFFFLSTTFIWEICEFVIWRWWWVGFIAGLFGVCSPVGTVL